FQSSNYYINENGKLVIGEIDSTKLSYEGDITIDAKGPGPTTVAVTNSSTGTANLSVQGDVTVVGGKITLASGETIDAQTADVVTVTSDGNIAMVLGDVSGAKKIYVYDSTGTNDVFSVDSDGNVFADGDLNIMGSFTAAETTLASLSVTGTATITGLLSANGGLAVTGNSTVSGTSTVGTLATGTTNTVVMHDSGLLQTRMIDGKVWDGALVDYLASTSGYLPMYSNSLGTLTNSSIFETGGKVGIGTTNPANLLDIIGGNIGLNENSLIMGDYGAQGILSIQHDDGDIWFRNTNAVIIDKPGSYTGGDPGFYILRDGSPVASMDWDDEGAYGLFINIANAPPVGPRKITLADPTTIGGAYSSVVPPTDGLLVLGNVGIGTTGPIAKFSVGASSEFQVNSTGNIVKINNVDTSFPGTQAA
ncbi:hypothetical protein COY32_06200, partial [candidate division WWE3 bacterium CG_4_10_14_0_2_um_filter_41_14]